MTGITDDIRSSIAARNASLDVFEIFSGTQQSGMDGAANIDDPQTGATVTTTAGISTLASLGLTGISYGLMQYTAPSSPIAYAARKAGQTVDIMELRMALDAAKRGETMTELLQILPYVGTTVKRMNIDAIWKQVGETLTLLERGLGRVEPVIEIVDDTMAQFHTLSKTAFYGFGGLSALGATATTIAAIASTRTTSLLNDVDVASNGLDQPSMQFAELAMAEVEYRMSHALGDVDARLVDVDALVQGLPDFDALIDQLAAAEKLLVPITSVTNSLKTLEGPYESFLNVADVIGAPINGVLNFFENPPDILPTITGYKTLVPGYFIPLTDIWVDPIKRPIFGTKDLFTAIDRDDVQKIIDLILDIAGIPLSLLEKALSPLLSPIEKTIQGVLQPIFDKLNPFKDYLDDFESIGDLFDDLRDKLNGLIAEIKAVVGKLGDIELDFNLIEAFGAAKSSGMQTFFGTDADEVIQGLAATDGGGFLDGAVIHGNGGNDTITGSQKDDFLSGGAGDDIVRGASGRDLILGGSGDDVLSGGAGNDLIDGGAGYDTAVFLNDALADVTLTQDDNRIVVTSSEGTDALKNVEEIQFQDQTVSLAQMFGAAVVDDDPVAVATRKTGGDTDDLIATGAGRMAFMTGGAGADVFAFKEETNNGIKEIDVVEDFALHEDLVRLSQSDVAEMRQTGGGVMLILSDDGDAIYLRGDALQLQDLSAVLDVA